MEQYKICTVILTKGQRKGQPCNRPLQGNEAHCKLHDVRAEDYAACSMMLVKGDRKNLTCGRKVTAVNTEGYGLCKLHYDLELKKPYNPYKESEYPFFFIDDGKRLSCISGELAVSELHPQLVEHLLIE